MTITSSDALRSARSGAIVTAAGANAKIKYYNGTRPGTGAAITTETLLATLVCATVLGVVTAGVLNLNAVTQTNANHVNGTPTWFRLTTSADVFLMDFSIPGEGTITGTITTGADVTVGTDNITEAA